MKVLITRPLPDDVITALAGWDVTVRPETTGLNANERISALRSYDAVLPTLGDFFVADDFEAAGQIRCKILANFGVGFNHIDVTAAKAHGVMVTNTPGAVTDATADIAMTLLLMSARRAGEGERLVRAGAWQGWHPTQLLGQHVTGKHIGIVGMGRIGQAIAKRAHFGFGMDVSYYSRSPKDMPFEATCTRTLHDLLRDVDFVVLAVPATPDTHHMIGAAELTVMQSHGHLINISRGDVVDEAALIAALQTRDIAGAGLDVYEQEPQVPEGLMALPNVTLLPHLGTAAREVRVSMGLMAVANLNAYKNGKTPPNCV
ncbi:MAG: 2-hydroxyacid dehydrogenase [Halocynthiibacter sp.]